MIDLNRLILCLLFLIPGLTLAFVSIGAIFSEKKFRLRSLTTTAVIKNYRTGYDSAYLRPQVVFEHDGKERVFLARAARFSAEDFPVGSEVTVRFLPGWMFYEVRLVDERIPSYSLNKQIRAMLFFGILLLIAAVLCVII